MIVDQTDGKLDEVIIFAKEMQDDSLQKCINSLNRIDENCQSTTFVFNDFAPKSFYFIRKKEDKMLSNGGIIYHGKHDAGGCGSGPTFSVNLFPVNGWAIHT